MNLMWKGRGSQLQDLAHGCQRQGGKKVILATTFWTDWSGERRDVGKEIKNNWGK